jgi:outer membrane protein assembly factor BamB
MLSADLTLAQFGLLGDQDEFSLSETVALDQADSQVAGELEQAKAYVADGQWNEAVRTLRQVMEQSGNHLWPVAPRRFITVRDYCHLRLADLPAPALALYRAQVDPMVRRWCERGIAEHNPAWLRKVVSEAFASSWGDDALLALGALALDSGDAAMARAWWERILPVDPKPEAPHGWLAFPDTDFKLADIRARLVLASILEGSSSRAASELEQFERLHPDARGVLAGREVKYADALRAVLDESATWKARPSSADWPTFAGAPARTHIAPTGADPRGIAWTIDLCREETEPRNAGNRPRNVPADVWSTAGPSYHPIRVGSLVLVNDSDRIWAVRLDSGKPAWGKSPIIFSGGDFLGGIWDQGLPITLGRPQFTMTACERKLYARMGNPWTDQPNRGRMSSEDSYLVGIDLAGEGRLLWKTLPESEDWSFEGSPLSDGRNVYVALRRTDIRPQAHVACYDARTGKQKWRRFLCSAETPARGYFAEMTHQLLTLDHGTLYYNTNLGAVAALSAESGHIEWVSLYPRKRKGNRMRLAAHWGRSLNPCVYHKGKLLVAPSDSRRIFAMDALTGQILWQTGSQVEDVVHLLGVAGDCLIASGKRLYWIDLSRENRGRIRRVWPPAPSLQLQGRGVLAGHWIYLPADGKVYVFDQVNAKLAKIIDLEEKGVAGGNLLVADGRLLISTKDGLVALGQAVSPPPRPTSRLTAIGRWGDRREQSRFSESPPTKGQTNRSNNGTVPWAENKTVLESLHPSSP